MAVGAVEHHEPRGRDPGPLGGLPGCGEQRRDGEEPAGAGIGELVGDLVRRVQRVDGGDRGARPQQAVEDSGKGRNIGAQDGCHAATPRPWAATAPARASIWPAERTVGGFRTAGTVDDGDPVQVLLPQPAEEVIVNAEIGNIDVGVRA